MNKLPPRHRRVNPLPGRGPRKRKGLDPGKNETPDCKDGKEK